MVPTVAFGGAVLCGGSSRRMGRDKATLAVDGVPMAARVAAALRDAGARPVIAIGGDPAALAAAGLEVTADDRPGEGPLAATVTALRCVEQPMVVIAACDLLHPQPAALARVAAELAADVDALVAVPVVDAAPAVGPCRLATSRARPAVTRRRRGRTSDSRRRGRARRAGGARHAACHSRRRRCSR